MTWRNGLHIPCQIEFYSLCIERSSVLEDNTLLQAERIGFPTIGDGIVLYEIRLDLVASSEL